MQYSCFKLEVLMNQQLDFIVVKNVNSHGVNTLKFNWNL